MLKVSFNIGNYPYSLAQSSEKCNENKKIYFQFQDTACSLPLRKVRVCIKKMKKTV